MSREQKRIVTLVITCAWLELVCNSSHRGKKLPLEFYWCYDQCQIVSWLISIKRNTGKTLFYRYKVVRLKIRNNSFHSLKSVKTFVYSSSRVNWTICVYHISDFFCSSKQLVALHSSAIGIYPHFLSLLPNYNELFNWNIRQNRVEDK